MFYGFFELYGYTEPATWDSEGNRVEFPLDLDSTMWNVGRSVPRGDTYGGAPVMRGFRRMPGKRAIINAFTSVAIATERECSRLTLERFHNHGLSTKELNLPWVVRVVYSEVIIIEYEAQPAMPPLAQALLARSVLEPQWYSRPDQARVVLKRDIANVVLGKPSDPHVTRHYLVDRETARESPLE